MAYKFNTYTGKPDNVGISTTTTDALYIRKDGTSVTSAIIPFALGLSSVGNISISKSSPSFVMTNTASNYSATFSETTITMTDNDISTGSISFASSIWTISPGSTGAVNFSGVEIDFVNMNASSAGTNSIIQAQNTTGASSNIPGGSLLLKGGAPNGSGTSTVQIFACGGFSSGGTQRTPFLVATFSHNTLTLIDAYNIAVNTTTGTKIGTATTQKLGFFNATPVAQQAAATDLGTTLSNLGLRSSGTAYPITTSGAVSFTGTIGLGGAITITDAKDIATGTTTGTKIGTATTQKIAFYNSTPVVQQTDGAALTNSVTSGGTTDTIANYTDLTLYANDSAAIRNNIYQLARKVKIIGDALRTYGLLS